MGFLIIGLIVGVVADRYVLPLCDMLLELISQCAARKSTSIQIDTNLMSLDYQEIADQGGNLSPAIGFLSDKQDEDENLLDEEEYLRNTIGFIK
ncbi:hypothetical protein BC351_00380 [Paenibacillus ferrarius]|uniref:Uncharacterized protein n=1 Tax=Paenibacillus ferrarius TaxID=1469647 RepID=A0A1V4HSD0_9BACL|nr:hypothetical protein [Paenibacillus ferrarius]OPH61732.1 hypothetical protein BC351_00380 [Paenibacillus ferrarius]